MKARTAVQLDVNRTRVVCVIWRAASVSNLSLRGEITLFLVCIRFFSYGRNPPSLSRPKNTRSTSAKSYTYLEMTLGVNTRVAHFDQARLAVAVLLEKNDVWRGRAGLHERNPLILAWKASQKVSCHPRRSCRAGVGVSAPVVTGT